MVNTPSPIASTQAPSLTLTLLLVACIVVSVFYGGLFAIFAIWTSSARWRHDMQVFIGLAADRLLRAVSQSVASVRARRPRRPRRLRLGDISPSNSVMTLLEVDGSEHTPATPRPDFASAFPLYTPPTTLPMPAITTTLIEDRPSSSQSTQAYEQYEQRDGYLIYRPREGYAPPAWPPSTKPGSQRRRFLIASGVLVDIDKLIPSEVAVLPWYADN